MKKNLLKSNKANIVFLNNVQYVENSKLYKSDECILKEEYCNTEVYLKNYMIKKVSFKDKIDLDFKRIEYFKVNTDILPWSDPNYLTYFNNINIDIDADKIETNDDIIITNYCTQLDILVCFQTKAIYGVYKTVMKYNLFRLVKELNCELWAPLDIRKPFKLVEKSKKKAAKKLKAIGEIKQEPVWWGIYHPFQLRYTTNNIENDKVNINNNINCTKRKKLQRTFNNNCELLKLFIFNDEDDTEIFLDNYPQFWEKD